MKAFLSKLKSKVLRFVTYCLAPIRRRGLTNRDFTIISNNCWGGFIYRRFNLPYRSPFVGLFLPAPCFIKLLEDFENNMQKELRFITVKESPYYAKINTSGRVYPIGVLGKDIEIHFLHAKTPEQATADWNRRKQRINPHNMLVKFAEMDCCAPDLIARFDKLSYKHKICFTVHDYPGCNSVVKLASPKYGTKEVKNDFNFVPKNLVTLLNSCKEQK